MFVLGLKRILNHIKKWSFWSSLCSISSLSRNVHFALQQKKGPSRNLHLIDFFTPRLSHFLLMTEEIPVGKNTAPSTGVLFRVANADFLIEEIGPSDFMPLDDGNPFSEYVEASLDCLAYSTDNSFGYNPVYMEARALSSKPNKTWRQSNSSAMEVQKDSSSAIWNDNSGVGSSKGAVMELDDEPDKKLEDKENTKWSDESGIGSKNIEQYNFDLSDEDDLKSPSPTVKKASKAISSVSTSNIRQNLTSKQPKAKEPIKNDEIEWTDDDESIYYTPPSDDSSSSDSDEGRAKENHVFSFDYSQSSAA